MADGQRDNDYTRPVSILAANVQFGQYKIIKRLGVGGMGEVYLAQDSTLNRSVALKFLNPGFATDENFRARFMREARLAAAVNHPNIITVYEVAERDERIYIALEFVEGLSLRELIDQKKKVKYETCLDIAVQVCEGLAAAHRSKLVHRDIKPANIIIDKSSRVRILDFGLAKSEADINLTQAGMTMGTVSYMAPEQSEGREPDLRGDIFSFGVVLYEMLTGKLPFKGDNIPATLYAIVNSKPEALSKADPTIPFAMQNVIDKALAKKPDHRYPDADAFKRDLMNLKQTSTIMPISSLSLSGIQPTVKALAVMYLRNLGGPDDEFLCYGLTEDLIVDLTRIGSIRVASMRSIMKYKDSDAELEEIAEKLNVGIILDGSIHKAGEKIRISAQLVEVASGENLWARRWEETLENLPRIKKDLAEGISQALQLGQTTIHHAQLDKTASQDAQAYESYLKAKFHFQRKKDRSDVDIALGLYQMALKEEPSLLVARAGIAEIMIYNGDFDGARKELNAALEKAREKKSRADEAKILKLMAELNSRQSNWDEAQKCAIEAMNINRELKDLAGEASAIGTIISILQPQAKFDEAIVHFDRVLEISRRLNDREQTAEALKNMGVAYSRKGDYDRALSLYEESLELAIQEDNLALQAACTSNIGNLHYFQGQFEAAYEQYEKANMIADQIGDRALAARQRLNMGLIRMQDAKYSEGADLLEEAANTFKSLGDRSTFAQALVNLSQTRLFMGDVEKALKAANKALTIGDEIHSPLVRTDALMQLGSALQYNRETDEALEKFTIGLEVAENANLSRNVAHIHLAIANLHFYKRDIENCRKHAKAAQSIARELGEKITLLQSDARLGAISAMEGLFNSGLRQIQASLRGIEAYHNHQMTIQMKTLLGEVLISYGKNDDDKSEGMKYLDEALNSARTLGLAPETRMIEEIFARNGDNQ